MCKFKIFFYFQTVNTIKTNVQIPIKKKRNNSIIELGLYIFFFLDQTEIKNKLSIFYYKWLKMTSVYLRDQLNIISITSSSSCSSFA